MEEEKAMTVMQRKLSRRRFLSISATAAVFTALPLSNLLAGTPLHRWNGILLGSYVSLTLAHPSKTEANRIFESCVHEIKRLENIFTLYDQRSELSRLNIDGMLDAPSPEMVDILEKSTVYNNITGGAFDITVKPLEQGRSHDLVGMDKVDISSQKIQFKKTGMAITLNGIAQGYITDHVTEILKTEGLENVLVELGEKRAIGSHPSGRPWNLALNGQSNSIPLIDTALATSESISPNTQDAHIFNPKNGNTTNTHATISVLANNATMADALSTGFMSLNHSQIETVKAQSKDIIEVYF